MFALVRDDREARGSVLGMWRVVFGFLELGPMDMLFILW
jgi:hypothetical protein